MPPIREILDPLTTTSDPIETAIQDVIEPITGMLIKNLHWTSYGMFFLAFFGWGKSLGQGFFTTVWKRQRNGITKSKRNPNLLKL